MLGPGTVHSSVSYLSGAFVLFHYLISPLEKLLKASSVTPSVNVGAVAFMILKECGREEETVSSRSTQRMGEEEPVPLALVSIWLIDAPAIESVPNECFHRSHH